MKKTTIITLALSALLSACQSDSDKKSQVMCTTQYDPICATVIDSQGNKLQKTFGNSCSLGISQVKVLKTTKGTCH